ncbi:MAG: hypothetical protein HY295_00210 [Thaumarchaeota archaeon]|nr:hypothetical protein [Nitrososphaerota archaeon]
MNLPNAIRLDGRTLHTLANSNLSLPFVILNEDIANELRLHKIACTYVRETMDPDSKKENRTGSHWLILESGAPVKATRNCNGKNCWNS